MVKAVVGGNWGDEGKGKITNNPTPQTVRLLKNGEIDLH